MNTVPKKIGRYTVERLLGQGAMGMVFLGRDPELDRAVAIKTVRDHGLSRDQLDLFLARFKNEARAAARLHHPSVVSVYDVGEDAEAGPYLVLEYVPGSSLKTILQSRVCLDPAEAVAMCQQIAQAVDSAHDAGIVHRDIKPDNLLVTPDGRTKLADFGVARLPDALLTREGQFLGTPCYAAPETLTAGEYGPRTDLFSLAAVLYEAVSGVRAFPGDEALSVASKVIHDQPAPPSAVARGPRVPPQVDAVIMAGLSKKPDERYPTAEAFAVALRGAYIEAQTFREEDVPSIAPSGGPHRAADRGGRGWTLLAVIVGGLAVGITAVLFVTGGSDGVVPGDGVDGGAITEDAGGTMRSAPSGDATRDAGSTTTGLGRDDVDASFTDSGISQAQSDAAVLVEIPSDLDSFEREERAKDAIDVARRAITRGDVPAARAAFEQAQRFDAENGDLGELRERIEEMAAEPR